MPMPKFREFFDVVAAGRDGGIGRRFPLDSVVITYPFLKIQSNRGFDARINLLLLERGRDISNNLKLCRADIFKGLEVGDAQIDSRRRSLKDVQ